MTFNLENRVAGLYRFKETEPLTLRSRTNTLRVAPPPSSGSLSCFAATTFERRAPGSRAGYPAFLASPGRSLYTREIVAWLYPAGGTPMNERRRRVRLAAAPPSPE
jgi:hypothetical protein